MRVTAQTAGMFSGDAGIQGQGADSDRRCTYSFFFSAQMTPDGTITSFTPNPTFRTNDCTPGSESRFGGGTASSTAIRIVMTDRATCRDALGRPRDTDVNLTVSVTRR